MIFYIRDYWLELSYLSTQVFFLINLKNIFNAVLLKHPTHVYYLGWNRSPAQVGCMRQALGPAALGKPRGSGWRGRWERGSGWGTHVNPWLFPFNVWQNPPQIKKKKRIWRKKNIFKPKTFKMFGNNFQICMYVSPSSWLHWNTVNTLWKWHSGGKDDTLLFHVSHPVHQQTPSEASLHHECCHLSSSHLGVFSFLLSLLPNDSVCSLFSTLQSE